jgi:DNA-binding response OmpR family regulator
MAKLLVVEDDQTLAGMLRDRLEAEHHRVELLHNGKDARDLLMVQEFDLIILDWELPGMCGVDICADLRSSRINTPVLMLTGKSSITDKVTGLNAGADDYLLKPFNSLELVARVTALLRRSTGQTDSVLKAGPIELDAEKFLVTRSGDEISLSRQEFALLEFLMRNMNRVFSPETLLERVWITDSEASPAAMRQCLKRLRSKIDVDGQESIIRTVHGVGYKLSTS